MAVDVLHAHKACITDDASLAEHDNGLDATVHGILRGRGRSYLGAHGFPRSAEIIGAQIKACDLKFERPSNRVALVVLKQSRGQ